MFPANQFHDPVFKVPLSQFQIVSKSVIWPINCKWSDLSDIRNEGQDACNGWIHSDRLAVFCSTGAKHWLKPLWLMHGHLASPPPADPLVSNAVLSHSFSGVSGCTSGCACRRKCVYLKRCVLREWVVVYQVQLFVLCLQIGIICVNRPFPGIIGGVCVCFCTCRAMRSQIESKYTTEHKLQAPASWTWIEPCASLMCADHISPKCVYRCWLFLSVHLPHRQNTSHDLCV